MDIPSEYLSTGLPLVEGDNYLELDAPWRGRLNKLIVHQVSGTGEFTVDVYNAQRAIDVSSDAGGASLSETMANSRELHKVMPTQHSSGGTAEYFDPSGQPYRNMDKATTADPTRKLYAKITVAGAGVYDLAYTITTTHI